MILALGCMAAVSLTSCLKDDNKDEGLSSNDFGKALTAVRGDYLGHMVYQAVNPQVPSDDTDTLEVGWSITADTMLTVRDFPLAPVIEKVIDSDLKKALQEQEFHQQLRCRIGFTMIDPYVEFLVAPLAMDVPILYKEQTHTLSVYFWFDDYSFGAKDLLTQNMNIHLVIAGAYLDGELNNNLLNRDYTSPVRVPLILTTIDFDKKE